MAAAPGTEFLREMSEPSEKITSALAKEAGTLLPEVYRDLAQPAAREVGALTGRAVRAALLPIRGLVWSLERAEEWVEQAVSERMERRGSSPDLIVSPPPQLAAGVLRGIQAVGPAEDSTLREMFANLLATAMEVNNTNNAHPAFAEILSQLHPTEARILQVLARRISSPIVRSLAVAWTDGIIPVIGEPTDVLSDSVTIEREVGVAFSGPSIQSCIDNLSRLGLVSASTESIDSDDLVRPGDDDPARIKAQKKWRDVRRYLMAYGDPQILQAVSVFEEHWVTPEPSHYKHSLLPSRRIALFLNVIWATSFGTQLLRATTEPAELGRLADVDEEASDGGTVMD